MIDYVDVCLKGLRKLTKVRSYDSKLPERHSKVGVSNAAATPTRSAPLYHTGDWVPAGTRSQFDVSKSGTQYFVK